MESAEVAQQKDIQHYGASVNAWFNSALEHDKSLLTLSTAGIGLLVTLLTTAGLSSPEALVLFAAALLSFLLCIACVLVIFRRNKTHIEQALSGAGSSDPLLRSLDLAASATFGAGALFAVLIGLSAAVTSLTKEKEQVTNKTPPIPDRRDILESVEAFNRLRPGLESLNYFARLKPASTPAPSPPATPTQATAEPPAQAGNGPQPSEK